MLKATLYGRPLRLGDEVEVEAATGRRWITRGIAESASLSATEDEAPPAAEAPAEGAPGEGEAPAEALLSGEAAAPAEIAPAPAAPGDPDPATLKVADLRTLAASRGVKGTANMNKDALLVALGATPAAPANAPGPDGAGKGA
jgi:hypothetical protein